MTRNILIALILVSCSTSAWSQFEVIGTIIGSDDSLALPQVMVREKGTDNIVYTDIQGKFKIQITNQKGILEMIYLGYITRETPINGRHVINTFLKPWALQHFWKRQKIKFNINSGILKIPFGGGISISSPDIFDNLILEGSIRYQTNFKQNTFSKTRISFLNAINISRFNLDVHFNRYSLSFQDEFSYLIRSIRFELFIIGKSRLFWRFKSTIGFDEITYSQVGENIENRISRGITLGIRKNIRFIDIEVYPKVTFFKGLTRYAIKASHYLKRAELYLRFQKTGPFTDLSLGMGWDLTYLTRAQKNINTYGSQNN